jgi:hypothetical protein
MTSINGRPTIINLDDVGKTRLGVRRPAAHFPDFAVLAACVFAFGVLIATSSEDLALWISQPQAAPVTLPTTTTTAASSCSLAPSSSPRMAPSGSASAQRSPGGS